MFFYDIRPTCYLRNLKSGPVFSHVCLSVCQSMEVPCDNYPCCIILTIQGPPHPTPSLPYPILYREPEPQHPFCTRTSGDQTSSFEDIPGADIYGDYYSMYVRQGVRTHTSDMLSSCYYIFDLNTIEIFPNSLLLGIEFVG